MKVKPVIIIGAARSGTNMIRDILTNYSEISSWNCDEINPIWHHYNLKYRFDDLPVNLATEKVIKYIRKKFNKIAQKTKSKIIVEKTCANSLRPEFIDKILPDAKYIFITRDGRDVISSELERWHSKINLRYTLKKTRYIPLSDIPHYVIWYIKNRLKQLTSRKKTLQTWGPRFQEMQALRDSSLIELCANQWYKSISTSLNFFRRIDKSRYIHIDYNDFVQNPTKGLEDIANFLNIEFQEKLDIITKDISVSSVGKWKKKLSSTDFEKFTNFFNEIEKQLTDL